ncbi:MAG: hypothetical protein WC817_01420 [Patescibacteria group bacterium]|jgi:hypothetical protein
MHKFLAAIDKLPVVSYSIAMSSALVAFFTPWPLSLVVLLGGGTLGLMHKKFSEGKIEVAPTLKNCLFALGIILLITSAFTPLFRSGEIYFGYDVGFYKHYLEQPTLTFPRPPALLLPSSAIGSRVFLDLLSLSRLPVDFILYGSMAGLFALTGLGLFVLSRKEYGATVASVTLILFALSFTQASAYQFFLWKQFFALALLLLTYVALYKKSAWAILPALFILVSHRTTGVFLLLSVFPTLWCMYPQYRRWILLAIAPVAIGFLWWQREALFILERILILGTSAPDYFAVREGQFISVNTYLIVNAFLLPLALAGAYYSKKRFHQPLFWLGVASIIFIIFQLPFYKRTLIFLDLSVIFYAGFAAGKILTQLKTSSSRIVSLIFLPMFFIPWALVILFRGNTITESFLQSVRQLQTLDKQVPVMVVSSNDAPWVWGWSGHDVIAPGLFRDKWNYDEWFEFWTTSESVRRQALMNRYPIAPYVYVSSPKLLATPLDAECFHQLNQFVYQYVCLQQNK